MAPAMGGAAVLGAPSIRGAGGGPLATTPDDGGAATARTQPVTEATKAKSQGARHTADRAIVIAEDLRA